MGFSSTPQTYQKVAEVRTVPSTAEANHLLNEGWDLFATVPGDSGYARERTSGEPSLIYVLVRHAA